MSYKNMIKSLFAAKAARATPQTQPLPGVIPNNAGGYFHKLDDWARLDRFLILGSDSGTFYVSAIELTRQNAEVVARCLEKDGLHVVNRIVEIAKSNRVPRLEPALFALALATTSDEDFVRKAALNAVAEVARTGTHILHFASYVNEIRGWGRGLRRAVGRWFTQMPIERFALQTVKYRQRDGWSLRDLLRLAHPVTDDMDRRALFDWIAHPENPEAIQAARKASHLVDGYYRVREEDSIKNDVIIKHSLPHEAVPTEMLNDRAVWDGLLVDMPMTAMVRNLGKMSSIGLLEPLSDASAFVAGRLMREQEIERSRIHPMQILLAQSTYAQGRGVRGSLNWTPSSDIIAALNNAYDLSFKNVEATGKRILVAIDVSGSMYGNWSGGVGGTALTPIQGAGAMAQRFVNVEHYVHTIAVDTDIYEPGLSKGQHLDDVYKRLSNLGGGGTDMSLPFEYLLNNKLNVDAVIVLTDNETWAGPRHPKQALEEYRRSINPQVKTIVVAMAANNGNIIDETDPLAMGVAGFDAVVPELVADFIRD